MKPLSRVVWHEGMHLAQHHFQAQNRYFENTINFALANLFHKTYGVAGVELDADALRNGTVSLIHARGVMPDGLAFHFPEDDPPPAPREIKDLFSPTQDSHEVMLAIPPYRADQANSDMGGARSARYLTEAQLVWDETTGRDEKPVSVGRKNFRILLDSEVKDDVVSLPLARIRRDGTGHFAYDAEYVPPILQIGASPQLLQMLARLVEILDAKGESI
ncbi:MAG TPA: type VI secretion system baseplate subunit TssK, partial [Gemmatimonadota bacterium]|nr:type VI secretion system baseplate subunit TssK [Gemmatimonadota bacterium]